jgi:hypothetical protein
MTYFSNSSRPDRRKRLPSEATGRQTTARFGVEQAAVVAGDDLPAGFDP